MAAGGGSSLLVRIVRRVKQTVPAYFVLALGLVISFAAWHFTEQRVEGRPKQSSSTRLRRPWERWTGASRTTSIS